MRYRGSGDELEEDGGAVKTTNPSMASRWPEVEDEVVDGDVAAAPQPWPRDDDDEEEHWAAAQWVWETAQVGVAAQWVGAAAQVGSRSRARGRQWGLGIWDRRFFLSLPFFSGG